MNIEEKVEELINKANTSYSVDMLVVTIARSLGFVIVGMDIQDDINGVIYISIQNKRINKVYGDKINCY